MYYYPYYWAKSSAFSWIQDKASFRFAWCQAQMLTIFALIKLWYDIECVFTLQGLILKEIFMPAPWNVSMSKYEPYKKLLGSNWKRQRSFWLAVLSLGHDEVWGMRKSLWNLSGILEVACQNGLPSTRHGLTTQKGQR